MLTLQVLMLKLLMLLLLHLIGQVARRWSGVHHKTVMELNCCARRLWHKQQQQQQQQKQQLPSPCLNAGWVPLP